MNNVIPSDVEQFLLRNIDSIAEIEGLILARTDLKKEWDVISISKRLYTNEKEAGALLAKMAERGLLLRTPGGKYKYCNQTSEQEMIIEKVVDAYRRFLLPVTSLIHSNAGKDRVQMFADAFIIKKEKD